MTGFWHLNQIKLENLLSEIRNEQFKREQSKANYTGMNTEVFPELSKTIHGFLLCS
jgi:hypothetical protein